MLDIRFDAFPVLTTDRLVLRQLEDGDSDSLFALRSDPVAMRYIDRPLMQNTGEAQAMMERIHHSYRENEGIQWVISSIGNPEMLGNITFWKIDKEHHRAEIGYMLHPRYQGNGFMGEALKAVIQYGFEVMRLHSIQADVNPGNAASIRLLERNGFIREAYFRENYYFGGKFLDSAIYSLLTPVGR